MTHRPILADAVSEMTLSASGDFLALRPAERETASTALHLYHLATDSIWTVPVPLTPSDLVWHPHFPWLAVSLEEGVLLLDASLRHAWFLRFPTSRPRHNSTLSWSGDGHWVAVVDREGACGFAPALENRFHTWLEGMPLEDTDVIQFRWDPVHPVGYLLRGPELLRCTPIGGEVVRLVLQEEAGVGLALAPAARVLVSLWGEGEVLAHDLDAPFPLSRPRFTLPEEGWNDVASTPHGRDVLLSVVSWGRVIALALLDGRAGRLWGHLVREDDPMHGFLPPVWHPRARLAATADTFGRVYLLRPDGEKALLLDEVPGGPFEGLVWNPEGTALAGVQRLGNPAADDHPQPHRLGVFHFRTRRWTWFEPVHRRRPLPGGLRWVHPEWLWVQWGDRIFEFVHVPTGMTWPPGGHLSALSVRPLFLPEGLVWVDTDFRPHRYGP